jgi:hypothetical protein
VEHITISIDADANVQLSVEGVAGPSCKDVTKKIESELGKTTSCKPTADYHKQETKNALQH